MYKYDAWSSPFLHYDDWPHRLEMADLIDEMDAMDFLEWQQSKEGPAAFQDWQKWYWAQQEKWVVSYQACRASCGFLR
jgi:hypothetical protein